MRIIYKYELMDSVLLPKDAQVLKVGIQDSKIMIWAMWETNPIEYKERKFKIIGTGQSFDYDELSYRYIDTIFDGPFVWHVFELND